jgi:hypothetical protein
MPWQLDLPSARAWAAGKRRQFAEALAPLEGKFPVQMSKDENRLIRWVERTFSNDQETWIAEPSSAPNILTALRLLAPKAGDTVYDIGAGRGRFVNMGAFLTPARFVGIELDNKNVLSAAETSRRLHLERARFVQADAAIHRYPIEMSHVYMFNPFAGMYYFGAEESLVPDSVLEGIHATARARQRHALAPMRIVTTIGPHLSHVPWLRLLEERPLQYYTAGIRLYEYDAAADATLAQDHRPIRPRRLSSDPRL